MDNIQELIRNRTKVCSNINPYYTKENSLEIAEIEQITIYHKKIKRTRMLGEFLKDERVKKRIRKKVIKNLMKYWDKEFHALMDYEKNKLLEKTKKTKRIKNISYFFVYLFSLIFILGTLIASKSTLLTSIPFLGGYVTQIYIMLEKPIYNGLLLGLTYLTLFTMLYIIIIKTYFDVHKNTGNNAEVFINNEFRKIEVSYQGQLYKIKKHLYKSLRRSYRKTYSIKKIFDPKVIINKLEAFTQKVEGKIEIFQKKYRFLLFIRFLLIISVFGLTGYLGYTYYSNYL